MPSANTYQSLHGSLVSNRNISHNTSDQIFSSPFPSVPNVQSNLKPPAPMQKFDTSFLQHPPRSIHQAQQDFNNLVIKSRIQKCTLFIGNSFQNLNDHPSISKPLQLSWDISHTQNSLGAPAHVFDFVDLMSEKNIIQSGFNDNMYSLPHNMANNMARVDPSVFRCTLTVVPQSEELLKKSRLPLGLTLHPFRDMKNLNIIQTSTIVRCRYCRTYINPYVYLPDSRHWKCNLCNRNNDLPDDFCWDPSTKSFGDPVNRPEIKHTTVEFIAPNEYMLRPPQPAVYVFVLDVAFVCVDSMVHFYQFEVGLRHSPKELVVDEINGIFLILTVRSFVEKIPTLFKNSSDASNCVGSALKVVHELIAEIGGRITVFQACIPNIGLARLKSREDPNQRAAHEVQNLGPATDFYKCLALECTGHQVAMDLFMLNTHYADLATLLAGICDEISLFGSIRWIFIYYHLSK
ncbi:Sec23/Sec24 trunk domain protein [Dictyocaulus viviparus]|uniref:Sec23/Sec24 trunk domain protein n=1 Tax=Dictyocaulus viviparus TaxID=29172 RepID=A0A0D8XQ68_DICVI|nr:Sec23/Sec24 trunk domain protein [Dictyocaulus viviparus]